MVSHGERARCRQRQSTGNLDWAPCLHGRAPLEKDADRRQAPEQDERPAADHDGEDRKRSENKSGEDASKGATRRPLLFRRRRR